MTLYQLFNKKPTEDVISCLLVCFGLENLEDPKIFTNRMILLKYHPVSATLKMSSYLLTSSDKLDTFLPGYTSPYYIRHSHNI